MSSIWDLCFKQRASLQGAMYAQGIERYAQGTNSVHGQCADNKPRASSAFCCKAEDANRTQVTGRKVGTTAVTPKLSGSRASADRQCADRQCADLCASHKDSCHSLVKLSQCSRAQMARKCMCQLAMGPCIVLTKLSNSWPKHT